MSLGVGEIERGGSRYVCMYEVGSEIYLPTYYYYPL